MGTMVGHVLPGFGFLVIGLWQLYNHIKLYCRRPKSYRPPTWFPFPGRVRHLELYLIMFGALTSISTELFVGPSRHQPLDPADWTIPTNHLHNFEHSTISLSIFIYAVVALRMDRRRRHDDNGDDGRTLSFLVGAASFATELLLFYLHSTDHAGLEWQYHWLLQTAIAASLVTTLMGVGYPRSFAVGFTRSVSVVFQGVWFNVLGIMLYSPGLLPKGCHLQDEDGFLVVPCVDHASLHRGKALVNLQFAWSFLAVVVFSVWLYLRLSDKYFPEEVAAGHYDCIVAAKEEEEEEEDREEEGLFPESPKKTAKTGDGDQKTDDGSLFLKVRTCFHPMDLER